MGRREVESYATEKPFGVITISSEVFNEGGGSKQDTGGTCRPPGE